MKVKINWESIDAQAQMSAMAKEFALMMVIAQEVHKKIFANFQFKCKNKIQLKRKKF
jgi:hypothetical protein